VRAGSIIPEQPVVQNTGETPDGPLELRVYPGSDCNGSLYLDDGHTYVYQKDDLLRVSFACKADADSVEVTSSARQGSFKPWWSKIEIEVFGAAAAPKEVRAGNEVIRNWRYDAENHSITFSLADSSEGWAIQVRY
jgi:alpha-glucosidase